MKKILIFSVLALNFLIGGATLFFSEEPQKEEWLTVDTKTEKKEFTRMITKEEKSELDLGFAEVDHYDPRKVADKKSLKIKPTQVEIGMQNLSKLHLQNDDYQLFYKKEGSSKIKRNNKQIEVEKVYLKILRNGVQENSFNAYVDKETGKVIETWNTSLHRQSEFKISMDEMGTL